MAAAVIPLWMLLLLLPACFRSEAGALDGRDAAPLEAAARDLFAMGFDRQAFAALEEAFRARSESSPEEGFRIAALHAERNDEAAAAECLERLYPPPRPAEVDRAILDYYWKAWEWTKVRPYLLGSDDPRRSRLEDFLSRGKRIEEPFSRTLQLNWRAAGCLVRPITGGLILSPESGGAAEEGEFTFCTPLGWNGRDFRMSVDLELAGPLSCAGVCFGLSEDAASSPATEAEGGAHLLFDYREGRVVLACRSPSADDEVLAEENFYFPLGLWLRIVLEYVRESGSEGMPGAPEGGRVRAVVKERASGAQLLRLEVAPRTFFEEGKVSAGFFQPGRYATSAGAEVGHRALAKACECYVDYFCFEN